MPPLSASPVPSFAGEFGSGFVGASVPVGDSRFGISAEREFMPSLLFSIQGGASRGFFDLGGLFDIGWGGLSTDAWSQQSGVEFRFAYFFQFGPVLRLNMLDRRWFGFYVSWATPFTRVGAVAGNSVADCGSCISLDSDYRRVAYNGFSVVPALGIRIKNFAMELGFQHTHWLNLKDGTTERNVDAAGLKLDQVILRFGVSKRIFTMVGGQRSR